MRVQEWLPGFHEEKRKCRSRRRQRPSSCKRLKETDPRCGDRLWSVRCTSWGAHYRKTECGSPVCSVRTRSCKLPSSAEEGWMRDQKSREATLARAAGVVWSRDFLDHTTPSAPTK